MVEYPFQNKATNKYKEASTAMFAHIYSTVKAYDPTKEMNICLPGMTSVNGSVCK